MRSPVLAIAWELSHRHRWGLLAVAGYLAGLAVVRFAVFEPSQPMSLDDAEMFALAVVVPMSVACLYFLVVFSFGLSGDLAARQSLYPARMFTLPVTTTALAGWPMLYGSAAMAGLWLATRLFGVWPPHVAVPWVWPTLLAAVLLGWTQALTWMPYGLPGLRVIVTVLWLVAVDTIVLLALHFKASEAVMLAILAPQIPLAFLAARAAVRRARRDDVPDWRGAFTRLGRIVHALPRPRAGFPSPVRAQQWFEWRLYGRSLPAWVGILLPFELALLFLADVTTPEFVFYVLLVVLLTPPAMAAFAAPRVRSYGMSQFVATRPITGPALIAAKLRMSIWSTLATWLLVAAAIPVALALSDTWPAVIEQARRLREAIGTPRTIVLALLVGAGLVASTWKQQVQNLYISLSGREWLIKVSVFVTVMILICIEPIAYWIHENGEVRVVLWNALPWIPAVFVGVKMPLAAWIATRLHHSRVLSDRVLVTGAACWLGAVLGLNGVLVWLFATPHMPRYFLLLLAILAIPLVRLSAAPLSLAWNRHR
jgi:hypothetical protein